MPHPSVLRLHVKAQAAPTSSRAGGWPCQLMLRRTLPPPLQQRHAALKRSAADAQLQQPEPTAKHRSAAVRVVTLCSGIEAPIQAYERLGIPFIHEASCDNDPAVKKMLLANFSPRLWLDDVCGAARRLPPHDMLWAGFPCQPFSLSGAGHGFADPAGRGLVVLHIISVIQKHMPKTVVVENVVGLVCSSHKPYFEALLQVLSDIRHGVLRYCIEWSILDSKHFGVPQSRPRVWIVLVRSDVLGSRKLVWPTQHTERCRNIDELLDKLAPHRGHPLAAPPPEKGTVAHRNCILTMGALAQAGKEPFKHTYVMDIDGSKPSPPMLGCSPCLTATRASNGGHWLSTRGRRLSTAEMCKLQAMDPARLRVPQGVSTPQFRKMLGNSMSVNIVEALLVMLNKAAPDVMHVAPLRDRWSARGSA